MRDVLFNAWIIYVKKIPSVFDSYALKTMKIWFLGLQIRLELNKGRIVLNVEVSKWQFCSCFKFPPSAAHILQMATQLANASSNSTDFSTPVRFYHQYMFYHALTIQLVICVCGILSNALFGVTFIRYPNLHTPFNTLAFALCVNDFFASLIAMPTVHALGHYQHRTKITQNASV